MQVTSNTPNTFTGSNTASDAPPTLSIVHRHSPIQFVSEGGSHGCTAYPVNYEELYNLKGRLLTLVDATFTDPEQRKAQKDVIWQTLQSWMGDIELADGISFDGATELHRSRADTLTSDGPA